MSTRKPIQTTVKEIVDYWSARVAECELSVDFSEAAERCWRCAYQSKLERCHIVPHSLGGEDSASNLVLLCKRCHIEAPNINDHQFFWDWLKSCKAHFYDTYWTIRGMKEYERIYAEKIEDVVTRLQIKPEQFKTFLEEKENFVTIHFGEGRLNPSTIAGIIHGFVNYCESNLSTSKTPEDNSP